MSIAYAITLGLGDYSTSAGSPPATPTLAAADNTDGTGAVATISAGSSSASNEVFTQPVSGGAFSSAGTRTGNGTVALSLGLGYYWVYVVSTKSGLTSSSNLVRFAVTSNAKSVATRLQDALVATIQGLSMVGSPNANLYERMVEDFAIVTFPCIFVVYAGLAESQEGILTGRDDIVYPFRIMVCDRHAPEDDATREKYQLWRQQLARALRNQRFLTVPENIINKLKYGVNLDPVARAQFQTLLFGLTLQCTARETRG